MSKRKIQQTQVARSVIEVVCPACEHGIQVPIQIGFGAKTIVPPEVRCTCGHVVKIGS